MRNNLIDHYLFNENDNENSEIARGTTLTRCKLAEPIDFSWNLFIPAIVAEASDNYVDIKTGLIAYYPFNGNANDESGNENNGIVKGATLTNDRFGNSDSAYLFCGHGDTIEIPDNDKIELTDDFTFSFWMKPYLNSMDNENGPPFITKHNSGDCRPSFTTWMIRFWRTNALAFNNYNPSYTCGKSWSTPAVLEQWQHMGIVYNNIEKIIKFYRNGSLKSESYADISILNNQRSLIFGSQGNENYYPTYQGVLDDIHIYVHALNEAEIHLLSHYKTRGSG